MERDAKPTGEVALQIPETTAKTSGLNTLGRSGPESLRRAGPSFLRLLCVVTSVVCLSLMVTSQEEANISLYGIQFPISSKWTFSNAFEYLVGVSAAAMAHSLLQLLMNLVKFRTKAPLVPSRYHGWIVFAGDQVFAYAMVSAASAAAGVSNLNRTGIRHTALPNFCEPLHAFCSRVAASIVFGFFSAFLLAASSILGIISLSSR